MVQPLSAIVLAQIRHHVSGHVPPLGEAPSVDCEGGGVVKWEDGLAGTFLMSTLRGEQDGGPERMAWTGERSRMSE